MSVLLTKSTLNSYPWLLDESYQAIMGDIRFLRSSYPNFDKWLISKVIPGIQAGERTVLIETRDSVTVGLLILKHTENEKKLCTLRVRPHYESRGLGVRLFKTAFEILGTERPLLSVSDSSAPKFERIFEYFGFSKEAIYEDLYQPMVDEISYNGLLKSNSNKNK